MIFPPVGYDYTGPLIEHTETVDRVDSHCRELGATGHRIWGCAQRSTVGCTIVIPITGKGGVGKWLAGTIRRFEIAHCGGMSGEHDKCELCRYLTRTH